jgi:hypothetical protein
MQFNVINEVTGEEGARSPSFVKKSLVSKFISQLATRERVFSS